MRQLLNAVSREEKKKERSKSRNPVEPVSRNCLHWKLFRICDAIELRIKKRRSLLASSIISFPFLHVMFSSVFFFFLACEFHLHLLLFRLLGGSASLNREYVYYSEANH